MEKKKKTVTKKSASKVTTKRIATKQLEREVGIIGFVILIFIGILICSCVTAWADTISYEVSTSTIAYL